MNKLFVLIFTFGLLSINLIAQIDINGKVFYNNKPVENVTVFLNNTTSGTTSDKNGEFNLDVQEGFHELIVSHVGFNTTRYSFNTANYNKPLLFSLVERAYVLNEVEVGETKYNADWRYNLSVFKREFIGTTEFSKHCKILNPKVLYFDFDAQENILTAYAAVPLHIRNEALGYDIFFNLEEFIIEKNKSTYLGYSQFRNLQGEKNKQKKWHENRIIAYNGSTVHFYKSVLSNRTREEGFIINQFLRKENEKRPSQQEIVKAEKLLASSKVEMDFTKTTNNPKSELDSALVVIRKIGLPKHIDYLHKTDIPASDIISIKGNITYLEFNDNLSIVYSKENEEKGYSDSYQRKGSPQTSAIIPLTRSSIINQRGILENPLNVIYEGYWSYEKLAHFLPLDYESTKKKQTVIVSNDKTVVGKRRVERSEFTTKFRKMVDYKTDYNVHYKKDDVFFLDGEKYSGIIFENWGNGNLKQEFEVKNGLRIDETWRMFDSIGNVKYDATQIGEYTLLYRDNKISSVTKKTILSTGEEGHRLTITEHYWTNGNLMSYRTFKDGRPHGRHLFYDNTGKLNSESNYENGDRHGLEINYWQYRVPEKTLWKNGKRRVKNL